MIFLDYHWPSRKLQRAKQHARPAGLHFWCVNYPNIKKKFCACIPFRAGTSGRGKTVMCALQRPASNTSSKRPFRFPKGHTFPVWWFSSVSVRFSFLCISAILQQGCTSVAVWIPSVSSVFHTVSHIPRVQELINVVHFSLKHISQHGAATLILT